MKFIFFVLLSLNVVFFFWGYFGYEHFHLNREMALRELEDPSIDRIMLVGEITESGNPPGAATKRGGAAGLDPLHDNDGPLIFPSVDPGLSESIEQYSESLVADLLGSEAARQAKEFQLAAANEFGIVSDHNPDNNSTDFCCPEIKLLAGFKPLDGIIEQPAEIRESSPLNVETAGSAGQTVSASPNVSNTDVQADEMLESVEESEKLCYKLGPRTSSENFVQITQRFNSNGIAHSIKAESIDVETAFMVYYPAAETFEASKANVKMLLSKGLRDLWLINKGAMRGSISLGVLKTRDRAEILQKEIEAKQIYPRIQPKLSKRTGYFLVFTWPHAVQELQDELLESGFQKKDLISAGPGSCDR